MKLRMALAGLLTVGAVASAGLLARWALAEEPAKTGPAEAQDKKDRPEVGPTLHGTVKAVDAAKHSLTMDVPRGGGTKAVEEKTFPVAVDVKVTLDGSLSKEKAPPAGRLADLPPGTGVTVRLSADQKAVIAIHARGPSLNGQVSAADAGKNTLTIRTKGEQGVEEHTVPLAKGAKITLSDGLTKEETPKEGQLSDLPEGTGVRLQLSVDRKAALGVQVLGASLHGTLKGVDVGSNTLTVTVKEDGQLVDKTLTLLKNARTEGAKLNELQPGQRVAVTLSVFDKTRAAVVRVLSEE
jgi:hypothetical protein